MLLRELLYPIRERIEYDYEDAANSVGYESAEGRYQLPTMGAYEVLDEVGLGWDVKNDALRDALAQGIGDSAWVHRNPYSLTEEDARRIGWEEFADRTKHRDKNNDQGAMVVDIGPYNIGINVQHRVTPNADPVGGKMAFHEKVSEIYDVTDGAATMVTQAIRARYETMAARDTPGGGAG